MTTMTLNALRDAISSHVDGGGTLIGNGDVAVTGVAYDSRSVQPGDMFVCIPGLQRDGHDFAPEAVRRGAVALLTSRPVDVKKPQGERVPQLVVASPRYAMGWSASVVYGWPSSRLTVVGITGTNGKTTTAYMIRDALSQRDRRCGLIGTVEQWTGLQSRPSRHTTPEAPDLQRLMCDMVAAGATHCAMEVSSHGLALHRTVGVDFDVAVFTNISRDHFDFHGDFDAYVQAKSRLFDAVAARRGIGIVNADDPMSGYVTARLRATTERGAASATVVTYGVGAVDASSGFHSRPDYCAENVVVLPDGVRYTAKTPHGDLPVKLALTGRFNVHNSLAALATASMLGVDADTIVASLQTSVVPGRFEPIANDRGIYVAVDYAHTPDGLNNVLRTARELARSGEYADTARVIVVFGAGGDRDAGKRPLMGEVAAEIADVCIITSDNPRSEDAGAIAREIAQGCDRVFVSSVGESTSRGRYDIITDRAEAIAHALDVAQKGDVVIVAGKGHETTQEMAGVTIDFDDREVVRRVLGIH